MSFRERDEIEGGAGEREREQETDIERGKESKQGKEREIQTRLLSASVTSVYSGSKKFNNSFTYLDVHYPDASKSLRP